MDVERATSWFDDQRPATSPSPLQRPPQPATPRAHRRPRLPMYPKTLRASQRASTIPANSMACHTVGRCRCPRRVPQFNHHHGPQVPGQLASSKGQDVSPPTPPAIYIYIYISFSPSPENRAFYHSQHTIPILTSCSGRPIAVHFLTLPDKVPSPLQPPSGPADIHRTWYLITTMLSSSQSPSIPWRYYHTFLSSQLPTEDPTLPARLSPTTSTKPPLSMISCRSPLLFLIPLTSACTGQAQARRISLPCATRERLQTARQQRKVLQ